MLNTANKAHLRIATAFFSACYLLLFSIAAEGIPQKPNVLFIAVDDLNTRLGCYGFDRISSPNIDKLASGGIRFDRAYCQYPSCGPSRSSVLSGLRPHTTGMINNRMSFRELAPDAITLPQLFRKNGYFVARVGKIFHQRVPLDIGTAGADDPASWTHTANPRGRDKDEEHLLVNHSPQLSISNAMAFLKADGTDDEQTDGMVATETIRLLESRKDEPFFIAAGFYRPHAPYIAPKRYFEDYRVEGIEVPHLPEGYQDSVPPGALSSTPQWPNFGTNEAQAREAILAYDACISFVDAQVGRVLDALDALGLSQSTIVVLWGDHGYHLGEHGLWRKNSLFEESARAPLIFRAPGLNPTSSDCDAIVEFVDIYPTLADLAGLQPPSDLEGLSLRPLLTNPRAIWDRPAYTQTLFVDTPGYSIRTDRWRYTEWGQNGDQGIELYDHHSDPQEMENLANGNQHAETIKRLSKLVRANWGE